MDHSIENVRERRTVVDEGTSFKGSLKSSCPVLVNGRVEGELDAPSVIVSATGVMQGKAHVGGLQSQGELSGEFEAERAELSGAVQDNTVIRAQTLELKLVAARGKMQVSFARCPDASVSEKTKAVVALAEIRPSQAPLVLRPSQPPPS